MITTSASSARPRRQAATVSRDRRISYTDRIYARLTLRGQLLTELTRERFDTLSAVLTALRYQVPYAQGLATLTVRNMTRGWSLTRPLLLNFTH